MNVSRHYPHLAIALAGLLAVAGCSHDTTRSTNASADEDESVLHFKQDEAGMPQPDERLFSSPEEAAAVFKDAVAAKDRRTLVSLFGTEGKALIFSGDRVQENNDLQAAADRMSEYLHIDRPSPTKAVLYEGKENWPFPIPLVKSPNGWFFDVAAGRDELLDRRIGEDELDAIAVCRAYVSAQKEYASKDRTGAGVTQYAQHFMSTPGNHDGLYWEVAPGQDLSPMGPLVAEARLEGYPATKPVTPTHKPHPYHGYIFRLLKAQGPAAPGGRMSYVVAGKMTDGFALVASPSAYGASGIMTFIVAKDGKVYQKDLGPNTKYLVADMTEYNPEPGWELVKD